MVQFLSPESVNISENKPSSILPPAQALLSNALLIGTGLDPIELYFEEEEEDGDEEADASLFELLSPVFQIQDSICEPEEMLNDKLVALPVTEEVKQKISITVDEVVKDAVNVLDLAIAHSDPALSSLSATSVIDSSCLDDSHHEAVAEISLPNEEEDDDEPNFWEK